MPAGGGGGRNSRKAKNSRTNLYGGGRITAGDKSVRRQLQKRGEL